MKIRSRLVRLSLSALLSAICAVASANPFDQGGRGGGGRGGQPFELPVYRFFYPHNFQTTDYQEGAASGMRYVGISFYVWNQPWNNQMYPLFKCRNYQTGDYFISSSNYCEGYSFLGELGWVSSSPNQYSQTPVYRCFGRGDHVATTNINECYQAQYQVEMTLGYVSH